MAENTIETWLNDVGLPQYAELFEKNGIDFDVLSELNAEHLSEIGISVLGHRLKLTKAIAALAQVEDAPPSDALTGAAHAERRQLTIMFCDLVGSTSISARLDPEDYRDLMTLYQETVSNVVTKAGGHVAKYLGDGVLIYFGYPIAQEDAAERATRAGLEIIETVAKLDPVEGDELKVRLGIATGLVVVGDLVGDGVSEASAVAGETPNLAARLQSYAEPGQLVIGSRTQSLLGEMFVYERLENLQLKGFDKDQTAWRVLSEAQTQERFAMATGRKTLSPLVGRDAERAQLLEAWDQAKSGHGRVFLISGEAGIGKSRLTHEIVDQAIADEANVQHFQAAPYFVNTAFYPILRQIEGLLDLHSSDDTDVRLNKMEYLVVSRSDLNEARALMASLLSLPTDRYPPLNLSPALQKARIIDMLIEQAVLASKIGPILLHFDDLHWTDPTSLEFLTGLINKIADHPILLVATYRPEFTHDWGADHIDSCELARLTPDDIKALLESLTRDIELSAEARSQLVDRSDGVPLFAEELTRSVLDANDSDASAKIVPDSLQDSLMARLDKLGATRELAQIGAVIGREFDLDLMTEVTGLTRPNVSKAISQLVDADLVFPARAKDKWVFRHALLQDAAYQSMLRRRRQNLHGRIAQTLEDKFPERCDAGPEQVANHFVAAGLGGRSAPYWLTAGKSAWARASAKEALAQLAQGLDFVGEVEETSKRADLELQLQSTIGVVHFAATSYASPQAQAAFERARELFQDVDNSDLRVAVLYGIGAFETMRGDVKSGHETFKALAEEAKRSSNARYDVYTTSMQAWSHFNRGNYAQSVTHGERVLDLYGQGAWDQPGPRLSAADPKVISECFRAAALWSLGYPDQAVKVGNDILDYARGLPDPYSLVYALANGVIRVHDWVENWDEVMSLTQECSTIAGEYGYGFLGLWASFWRARAMAALGQVEEAEKMTAGAVAACKNAGVHYHSVCFESYHARQLLALDRVQEASEIVTRLDQAVEQGGETSLRTDLFLVQAEVAKVQGNADAAKAHYEAALANAKAQSARSWQLRAVLGLASLHSDRAAQSDLIAPVLATFDEGFDTPDVVKAKSYVRKP